MHGEVILMKTSIRVLQERLSQEWTMHTIVWRNKPEIKTLSLDDLFNNLIVIIRGLESVYEEDIKLLKCEIYLRDLDITELKRKLELATKEKDGVQLTIQKFENSSKNLSKLLERKIMDKCKTRLGYNVVLPPYIGNFMPIKSDLVYPSLDDFVEVNESVSKSVVEKPTVETNEPKNTRKENGAPIIEDWVSESEEEDVPKSKTVKMFNKPSFAKINFVKSTEQVKSPRKTLVDKNRQNTPSPKGNKRNWNQQLVNTVKGIRVNIARLKAFLSTVKGTRVNTARPKAVLSVVKGNKGNVVKALTCWGNPQQYLRDKGVIESGCSRYMTGNRSYLTDYEEIDGEFVAFGGNSKRGKITWKGKIRTGKLDFEDVYFVKEQKFNLFSVLQMCDKKNSVLFSDTACVVLSPDFKLTDENHVLLKVPRKDNMYSVEEQDVVEKEVSVADPVTTVDEVVTTASVKVSTAKVAIDSATTTTDKGKAKMTEPEKPLKKKDQIMYDQEVALNLQAQLQAELEEEERLARQKEEKANIALIES
ncbi:hypothetical protein Tco_0268302 [Tanacetum coccineum]